MAWLGEGFSTLKGQIQSFTKEVLSEGREDSDGNTSELVITQQKVEELEALCATQDLEISALRQQNANLQRRLQGDDPSVLLDTKGVNSASTWWTVEQRCDTAYNNGSHQEAKISSQAQNGPNHTGVLEDQEKELKEKDQLLEILKAQLEKLEEDKHQMSKKCSGLEEQVCQLTNRLTVEEGAQLQVQLQTVPEQHVQAQAVGEETTVMREELIASHRRIEELEGELQTVQQQLLDHLSESQTNANELRGEVEQTRWQLLQESGSQKTELLRARQDMVNRIIQMGEKSREVEQNMKKLQAEGKHLSADMVAIIRKLGDPEQQELIHGALNALELENQVLKLRNAQLELSEATEALKSVDVSYRGEHHFGEAESKCTVSDVAEHSSKYLDVSKLEDDFDTLSLKSEYSELSQHKQRLETQVSQLQGQVETYKRDIKHYEMTKLDWSEEKDVLERHLADLKEQLREKEESLSLVTAQKGLLVLKQSSDNKEKSSNISEVLMLKTRNEELSATLADIEDERDQLSMSKTCLSSELEAMARIVQDLECQLAKAEEDQVTLSASLEELDRQHQDAIDQLLSVKKSLQTEKDNLQLEVTKLQQKLDLSNTRIKPEQNDKVIKRVEVEVQTNDIGDTEIESNVLSYEKFQEKCEKQFQEKLLKLVTFEIPMEYYTKGVEADAFRTVEAMVKAGIEWKWKKDTLERKVAEMMKEGRDAQATITKLEKECGLLRVNVETLVEELAQGKNEGDGLASIPEHSEEMEQRVAALESEVEVLREARSNLEADAAKLREEGEGMVRKLHSAEAVLRNQENLEAEAVRWQETVEAERCLLQQALQAKNTLEVSAKELQCKFEELETEHEQLKDELVHWQDVGNSTGSKLQAALESATSSRTEIDELLKKLREYEDVDNNLGKWQEEVAYTNQQLQEALQAKSSMRAHTDYLQHELQEARGNVQQLQEALEVKSSVEKHVEDLECQLQEAKCNVLQLQETLETKSILYTNVEDLQCQLQKANGDVQQLKEALETKAELENKIMDLESKLQQMNALVSDQTVIQAEVVRWQGLATTADQKLQEALHAKLELEHNCSSLQSTISSLADKQVSFQELKLTTEQQNQEIHSLKLVVDEREKQLNDATQKLLKFDSENGKLLTIQNELHNEKIKLEMMLKAKNQSEQLHNVCEAKANLEERIQDLQLQLNGREQQLLELQSVMSDLDHYRNIAQEVDKWRMAAQVAERQLDETFQARAKLEEEECKRLFAMETQVHNQEHLERDVSHLTEMGVELEKRLSETTLALVRVEQERDQLQSRVTNQDQLEEEVSHLTGVPLSLEAQLIEMRRVTLRLEQEREELETRVINKEQLQSEVSSLKHLVVEMETQLNDARVSTTQLQLERDELKSILTGEGELNEEILKLRQLLENNEQVLQNTLLNRDQLRDQCQRLLATISDLQNKVLQNESTKSMEKLYSEEECKTSKGNSEMVDYLNPKMIDCDTFEKTDVGKEDLHQYDKDCGKYTNKNLHFDEQDNVLRTIQAQLEGLQSEKQSILSVLDEKTRENGLLKADNSSLVEMISAEKSAILRLEEEKNKLMTHHQFQNSEAFVMAKETIGNLSKIIKDKDLEMEALTHKCESLLDLVQKSPSDPVKDLEFTRLLTQHQTEKEELLKVMTDGREAAARLQGERDELVRTVHVKHQESIQYHTEIQRLNVLLGQELNRSKEMQIQVETLAQELEVLKKQKDAEGNDVAKLQSTILSNDEALHRLGKLLEIRDQELKERGMELESLRQQVWILSQEAVTKQRNDGSTSDPNKRVNEELREECTRLTENLKQERSRSAYMQNEMKERQENESALQKELERLRLHLVVVEETYTQEALNSEVQVKELQSKLVMAEERIKNSSTAYTSASIRANQQVETLQGQTRLVVQQRDDVQQRLSAAEDQVQRHAAALRNLQVVLEQFQRDKEREIMVATEKVYQQVIAAQARHDDLLAEIASLKVQLSEAKEGLSAAARLGEQLDKKSDTIQGLREEVSKIKNELSKAEEKMQSASLTVEGKVDRSLVKNLVVGYFLAPSNHREEVLRIVATVLDFSQEERGRVGLEPGQGATQGWFRSLMQPSGKGLPAGTPSLSEAFIRFLESESRPQPQLRLLPDAQEPSHGRNSTPSPSSSSASSQRRSPLLLSEVRLPTFGEFPIGRNSSSILKDVLKDS